MQYIEAFGDILLVVILVIYGLFLKQYLPSYMSEKGKNLATKEDIEVITEKVERVRTQYAVEIETLKAC